VGDLLLDTGPIVALLNRRDADHESCAAFLESFRGRMWTTEPVLTEAVYLLSRVRGGPEACLEFFVRGGASLVPQSPESLIRAKDLMSRYREVPMDFADASLVALADETRIRAIFSLDRRGFSVFRLRGGKGFEIFPA